MKPQKPLAEFGHTARVFARAAFGLRLPSLRKGRPGAAPGIEHEELATLPSQPGGVKVTVVDYAVGRVEAQVVEDIAASSRSIVPSGRRCAGSTWTASPT